MPLELFPPEQESTLRVVAGQRTYRVNTTARTVVVNGKTFTVDGDNRFSPLARIQILSEFTSPNAQSNGAVPDCSPYWANDVFSRFTIIIASIRLLTATTVMPGISEFQVRHSFGGIPTVRSTLSLGKGAVLVPGDVLGLLVSDSGGMGANEIEIWGRVPNEAANAAQTNANPYEIVFGVAIEMWPTTENEGTLGKFVTAIP